MNSLNQHSTFLTNRWLWPSKDAEPNTSKMYMFWRMATKKKTDVTKSYNDKRWKTKHWFVDPRENMYNEIYFSNYIKIGMYEM